MFKYRLFNIFTLLVVQRPGIGQNSDQKGGCGTNCEYQSASFQSDHNFDTLFSLLQIKELDLSKAVAERSLREHKGDLIKVLHALTE